MSKATERSENGRKRGLDSTSPETNPKVTKSRKVASPDSRGKKIMTPLRVAIRMFNYEMVYELVNLGVKDSNIRMNGVSLIWWLADCLSSIPPLSEERRYILKTIQILISDKKNYKIKNTNEETTLMLACRLGFIKVVRKHIKDGVDLNAVDKTGRSALMYADLKGSPELIRVLLEAGADPEIHDCMGETVLTLAISRKHNTIAKMLLGIEA